MAVFGLSRFRGKISIGPENPDKNADFKDNRWAWNSCRKPYFLWEKYPDLLHVEPRTFLPSWDQWEVSHANIQKIGL